MIAVLLLGLFQEDFAELIRKLGSEKVDEREEAVYRLRRKGSAALPDLERAAKEADSEVAVRARSLAAEILGLQSMKAAEDKLRNARSARIRFDVRTTLEVTGQPDQRGRVTGTLLLGAGRRLRLQAEREHEHREQDHDFRECKSTVVVVCDGELLVRVAGDAVSREPAEAGPSLRPTLAKSVVRAGMYSLLLPDAPAFQAGDLSDGGDVASARAGVVSYSIETNASLLTRARMTLTCDPKTLLPRERRAEYVLAERKLTVVETYEEVTLDPDLPASSFTLPRGK